MSAPESDLLPLVEAARAGDRASFTTLHDRYRGYVHALLLARISRADADDLVQEVFLTAWRRLSSLREPAAFGAWLGTIARNHATSHMRRRRPTDPLPESLSTQAAPSAEASEALAAIRALPEAYRETLLLRLVEGWTGPEIAARTGLTPGSVRVNLHRGMQLLRRQLGAEKTS